MRKWIGQVVKPNSLLEPNYSSHCYTVYFFFKREEGKKLLIFFFLKRRKKLKGLCGTKNREKEITKCLKGFFSRHYLHKFICIGNRPLQSDTRTNDQHKYWVHDTRCIACHHCTFHISSLARNLRAHLHFKKSCI